MAQDLKERYINFYTDFAIRHLPELIEKPQIMEEEIFTHLFEQAEIAKFTKQEREEYEESLKAYRDWYSVTKTAFDKGKAEGREEGREEGKAEGEAKKAQEIALNLISNGLPDDFIARTTGLRIEEIKNMR